MNLKTSALILFATPGLLLAQDAAPKPYQEGHVHAFLEQARANERPAVVLFNFNLDSG